MGADFAWYDGGVKEDMTKQDRAKILSLAVSLSGAVVMAGWAFDVPALTSVLTGLVTMKFVTAMCFFFTGLILFALASRCDDDSALMQFVLPTSNLLLLIVIIVLFADQYLDIRTGIEHAFVREPAGAVGSVAPGVPSVPTMLGFLLVAIAGEIAMIRPPGTRVSLRWIGAAVALVGFVALVGYATGTRELFFEIPSVSSGMAVHTAALFVVSGAIIHGCVAAREPSAT